MSIIIMVRMNPRHKSPMDRFFLALAVSDQVTLITAPLSDIVRF
jgi:PIN domain nuclease of toxin-antitoxin system